MDARAGVRFYSWLLCAGLAWRLVVSWRMVLPREDGVNYLWMAERFAEFDVGAALSEVFSPLLAMGIAIPVALGLEPFVGGQVFLAVIGVLAVLPIAKVSEALLPGTERVAAVLAVAAHRPMLLGAEIYTEPLFLCLAATAFLCGLRARYLACGVLAGLAFWVRPEAALIPLCFLGRQPARWLGPLALAVFVIALATWRGAYGHGFDPVPKLAFIKAHNVAGETDALGFVLRSLWHLVKIPGEFFSAFGVLAFLAIVGAYRRRPGRALLLFAMAVAVICLYVPRWRFLVNWMFLVVPLAAGALQRLPGPRWWMALAIVASLFWSLTAGDDSNRLAEQRVAKYLAAQLEPGERIAGDMTRVHYFAGQRPLEPRHYNDAEELIAAGRGARFVVLRTRRPTTSAVVQGLRGHRLLVLPPELRALAAARGMTVLAQR